MFKFEAEKQYGICSTQFNKTIILELQKQGINLKVFPSPQILKTDINSEVISNLSCFDWIIFPDIYAVEYFIEILEAEGIDLFELDLIRVCALGESVSDSLRFSQIHADLIPIKVDSETIINGLKSYVSGSFARLKILVLQNSDLLQFLMQLGAEISFLEIYQTVLPNQVEVTKLKTLLTGGAIDVFLFSNVADVINLKLLFSDKSLTEVLFETDIIALESATYQYLREIGFQPKLFKI
jgi:uroporphyrinogen-III synthase